MLKRNIAKHLGNVSFHLVRDSASWNCQFLVEKDGNLFRNDFHLHHRNLNRNERRMSWPMILLHVQLPSLGLLRLDRLKNRSVSSFKHCKIVQSPFMSFMNKY